MTNPIYNHTTYPVTSSSLSSSGMRAELDALTTGLNVFPALAGSSLKIVGVNAGETAYAYVATTGTGSVVLATSPALTTPTLGAATATSINGLTITASTGTFTLTNGKTLTCSNTLTLAGTDGSTLNIGTGGTLGAVAYGGVVPATLGGTGVANNSANTVTYSGSYGMTFTLTGATAVTFPTSGTLAITTQATDTFGALTDNTTNNVSASAHGFVPKYPNNTTTFFRGDGTYATPPTASFTRSARTSNTIIAATDNFTFIDITSGTFSQTFNTVATLGAIHFRMGNSGTGTITLTPNVADTIDGLTSYPMFPGEIRDFYADGVNSIITRVVAPFYRTISSTETMTRPPGYQYFGGLLWSGGGAGGYGQAGVSTGGGGGGACVPFLISSTAFGSSQTITIGAGGTGVASLGTGGVGGNSTIGSLAAAYGGGGGGGQAVDVSGGGGGGALSVGPNGGAGGTVVGGSPSDTTGYKDGQGFGGGGASIISGGANSAYGGAGGGAKAAGGNSVYGGAGGGGITSANALTSQGTSVFGGDGAAASVAGTPSAGSIPGGGGGATHSGGASGDGGQGQCIIWGVA